MTQIDPDVIDAYLKTEYHVFGRGGFVLRLGERCTRLAELFAEFGLSSGAFISAMNPKGLVLSVEENQKRQDELRETLYSMGLRFIEGCVQDPIDDRSEEEGIFVLGGTLNDLKAIGAQFAQDTIIWIDNDARPELIRLGSRISD